jgi:SAM-dependent methyltransferase
MHSEMKSTGAHQHERVTPADETDHRGWFYRVVASDPERPVLEIGAPFVRHWFSDVASDDLRVLCQGLPSAPRFAMVILHLTLGGCASIAEALRSAHSVLEPGGAVALAGLNRMRVPVANKGNASVPRATPWGYRRAALRAHFSKVELYVAHPDLDKTVSAVSIAKASSEAFFRHELAARKASGRDRLAIARRVLAELNLAPHLQPFLFMIGRKC